MLISGNQQTRQYMSKRLSRNRKLVIKMLQEEDARAPSPQSIFSLREVITRPQGAQRSNPRTKHICYSQKELLYTRR